MFTVLYLASHGAVCCVGLPLRLVLYSQSCCNIAQKCVIQWGRAFPAAFIARSRSQLAAMGGGVTDQWELLAKLADQKALEGDFLALSCAIQVLGVTFRLLIQF